MRYPYLATLVVVLIASHSRAVSLTIIDNNTRGYYNGSIGALLDGTSEAFPVSGDPDLDFTNAPNLTPAQGVLGNWLGSPPTFPHEFWTPLKVEIPRQWPVDSESAIVYQIDAPAGGYSNVVVSIGADNGIFVWLDGHYLGGFLRAGSATLGEHQFAITNISGGIHYLQLLREDHGGANDYLIEVTVEAGAVPVDASIYTAVEVTWQSVQDKIYQPQSRDDMTFGVWTNFGLPIVGNGSVMSLFDSTRNQSLRFYKVLQIQ